MREERPAHEALPFPIPLTLPTPESTLSISPKARVKNAAHVLTRFQSLLILSSPRATVRELYRCIHVIKGYRCTRDHSNDPCMRYKLPECMPVRRLTPQSTTMVFSLSFFLSCQLLLATTHEYIKELDHEMPSRQTYGHFWRQALLHGGRSMSVTCVRCVAAGACGMFFS